MIICRLMALPASPGMPCSHSGSLPTAHRSAKVSGSSSGLLTSNWMFSCSQSISAGLFESLVLLPLQRPKPLATMPVWRSA